MSDAITFAGNPLDRAKVERTDPDWIDAQLQLERTRFLPLWGMDPLVKLGAERSLAWATHELFEGVEIEAEKILLGVDEAGVAHFAVDLSDLRESPEAALGLEGLACFEDLRAIAPQLDSRETGIAAQARSLVDWHASNRWCPACGGGTRPRHAGGVRVCGDCLVEHYPRTNPVAIAVVTDGERCLLGRSPGWPSTLYSALAGFIEPGETIEEGLRREVAEEAGIEVGGVTYVRSQPWPFPSSLMIGCIARAESTDIEVSRDELEHAEWFDRGVVEKALLGRSAELFIPPALALAHHLIRAWVEEG